MSSHDNFVPVAVDMLLLKGDRLGQDVKTGSHKIDVQHRMIADKAEDALKVISHLGRAECNDDSRKRKRFHCALCLREAEQVVLVCDELECRRHIVVVLHVNQSIC